ncbi:MAG: BtaA family protein [Lentisphaeraceae bacterium]|nr:BtaA family protein [Lentisphaeraceae bacterium]
MIATLDLHKDITSLPIYFSQVREDPLLDWEVIDSLQRPSKVLMIASGGDSVCKLSSHPNISSIDAVDANNSQLAISRFKLSLLKFSSENRLKVLGHEEMDRNVRWQILKEICSESKVKIQELGPKELLFEEGLDFTGRYEQLFIGIQKELKRANICPEKLTDNIELIRELFTEHFSLDLLLSIFGKAATQNPLDSFHNHFFRQLLNFLDQKDSLNSPFLNQMLYGSFSGKNLYEWLKLPALKESDLCNVNFHNHKMLSYLLNSEDSSYDFIHLSNILDWLKEDEAVLLLDNVFRVLKRSGKVIVRQLNSKLDIPAAGNRLNWDYRLSQQLKKVDQSFFYRSVLVGEKIQ